MDRRRFLGVLSSLGGASLAGCSAPRETQLLSNPTEERDEHGETHLQFAKDEERIATLSIVPGRNRAGRTAGNQLPITVSIAHSDRTTIISVEIKLRTEPGGGKPPATVALQTPFGTPHPPMDFYTDPDDGGAVLRIPSASPIGRGTVTLEFLLSSLAQSTAELAFEATIDLTTKGMLGDDYTLSANSIVPLPP